MFVVPFFLFPPQLPKEQARKVPILQRTMTAVTLILTSIAVSILTFFTSPRVNTLYKTLNQTPSFFLQYSFYIGMSLAFIGIVLALYLLFTKPNFSKVDLIAKGYKDGEMIRTSYLLEKKHYWSIGLILLIMAAYVTFCIILPITSITNQIN